MKETKEKKENSLISKAKKIIKNEDSKSSKKVEKCKNTKAASSKSVPKASSQKITTSPKVISSKFPEYYDLPYRYNQTVIKILAQTPHSLFIYWDISDNDRQEMIKKYGEAFFYETKPILLVHNKTLNTNFEVEIDDFTNSWYLRTPTSNCVFEIELGRKKINENNNIVFDGNSNVMHITNSNVLESPNDHILSESLNVVYFRNVKTNEIEKRDVSGYKLNNIYNLIDLQTDDNDYEKNPSSGFKIS